MGTRDMSSRVVRTRALTVNMFSTLIVTGAEDTLIPPKEAEAMRKAIRGARFASIPGAAHLSNFEAPDAFNAAVREFLKTVA
jgi:3-oxoadipate enol-lactonase